MPNTGHHIKDLGVVSPPLGLAYIGSYVRKTGNHEVRIHDGLLHNSDDAGFVRVLESFSPDVVGISGQATPAIYDVYHIARLVKRFDSKVLVVVGGAHVTFQDQETLNDCSEVDVVVRGEGEVTMSKLLDAHANNEGFSRVPGITFRKGSSVIVNKDNPFIECLDSLPFPAYDLLDLPKYFLSRVHFATMITSRGCPFGCRFCTTSGIAGNRWRARTPENVLREMRLLVGRYGVREVAFVDDLFTLNLERVRRFCRLVREEGLDVGWGCSTRADLLSSHPEMAEWLRSAGCHTLYIGAESGSQRVLNLMRKGIRVNQVVKAVKIARKAGLTVVLSFIIGFPGETREEIEATIDFAHRVNPDLAQFAICTPYPGSPLYEEAKRNAWINACSWKDFSGTKAIMEFPGLTRDSIEHYLHKAYMRFYARPSFIWKQLKSRNLEILKVFVRTVAGYLRKPLW